MCFCFLSRLLVSSHEGWYQSCMGRNKRIHKNATELCDHIMASGHLRQNNDVEKDHYYLFRCDKWLHCFLELLWQLLIPFCLTSCQFQVALILLMSIIIPMLVSATMIAFTHPFVVLRALPWKKLSTSHSTLQLVLIRTMTIIGFLFVPALLIVIGGWLPVHQQQQLKSGGHSSVVHQSDHASSQHHKLPSGEWPPKYLPRQKGNK